MRKKYSSAFKNQIIQEFEAISPKPRHKDFASDKDINLETFKSWLYETRRKSSDFGIVELKSSNTPKPESKIPVHITLHSGVNIETLLEESQFYALLWQQR